MKVVLAFSFAILATACESNGGGENSSSSILKQVWKIPLNKIEHSQGFELPLIDGNRAYLPNGPDIECRELETGNILWKANISGTTRDYHGTRFMANSSLIVVNDTYSTSAFNKFTGEKIWVSPDSGVFRRYGIMNWIDDRYGYRRVMNGFLQYDLSNGGILKEMPIDTGGVRSIISNNDGIFCSTLADFYGTNGEILYEFGTLKKYDPVTGNQLYSLRATPRWFNDVGFGFYPQTITNLFAVPVILDTVGYSVFSDGTVFKFRLSDGHMYWEYRLPLTNYRQDFPDAISVFPDEEKGLAFVTGGRDNWFCLDMETGKQLYWKRPSDNDGVSYPSSYDGHRYVFKPHTYTQWEWYIIDITTGEVVEEFDIPDDSILSQDVKNGYVAAFGVLNFYVFKIVR